MNRYHEDLSPSSIVTKSGHAFDILDNSTWRFDLHDIAWSLSRQCRFIGHVEFYSVAEHSIRVADLLKTWGYAPGVQLLGLMHDAAEAYIGDIPGPHKDFISVNGRPIKELERDIEILLFQEFGIFQEYYDNWGAVKDADHMVYKEEAAARPNSGILNPVMANHAFLSAFQFLSDAAYQAHAPLEGQLVNA